MRRYLLVDGELYHCTSEPRYCIYTFGLGHNHGGTALSVDYRYNPNISKNRYFSALQGVEAVAESKPDSPETRRHQQCGEIRCRD